MARRLWAAFLTGLLLAAADQVSAQVERADDAYHYPSFADGQHDALYTEWWYFNVRDPATGTEVAVAYTIVNPDDLGGFGTSFVTAIVYASGTRFAETNAFPASAFFASTHQADAVIADGGRIAGVVRVLDDDTYVVAGAVQGAHRVSWALTYRRIGTPWPGLDRAVVGAHEWERMSWLVYMPAALVGGRVEIDGREILLDGAAGYHDHNWGEWNPLGVAWNWAQYAGRGVTLAIGDFIGRDAGAVRIETAGGAAEFGKPQYRLVHAAWTIDPDTARPVPKTSWLIAEHDRAVLVARLDAVQTQAVRAPPELPFPVIVPTIWEQTARITGWLWEKRPDGTRLLRAAFDGDGFKEYTGVSLRQPPAGQPPPN